MRPGFLISDLVIWQQKNVRPGFLISQFSRSSQNEKTALYTLRLRCSKIENPCQILPEFFFPGRANGLDFAITMPVYLFRVFGTFFLCMRYFLKGISSLFLKKSSFFLPLFFLSFFLFFFPSLLRFARNFRVLLRPGVLISQFSRSKKVL